MAEEQKTRLSVVIEPDGFDSARSQAQPEEGSPETGFDYRQIGLSAREAFFLNAHPLELMRRFPESEWGWVLREIERHQHELDAQRTPEQRVWVAAAASRGVASTARAARLITHATNQSR